MIDKGLMKYHQGGEIQVKKYIGIKLVEAEEMDKLSAYTEIGWDLPRNEDPNEPGYLVKYPDGYQSYCPKDQFEKYNFGLTDGEGITEEDINNMMLNMKSAKVGDCSTYVEVEARSGFTYHEVSSCVSPEKYDDQVGQNIGLNKIADKIWTHLGFVLKWAKYGLSEKPTKTEEK